MPLVIEATWLIDPPTAILLSNEPDTDRVVQRDFGQTYSTLSLNGTYTGGTPGTVEARVRTNAGATIVDWTVVAAAPSGGTWAGSLVIPTCEDVKIEVRCSRTHSVSWSGSHRWHVGIVFIGDGQSDFENFMASVPPTVTASAGTSVYSTERGWLPASTNSQGGTEKIGGAGIRTFLNFIKAETGIPCGIVYGGASGVGIVDLMPGSANFDALASYIAGSGGKAEAFLWHHGPGDAAAFGVEPSVYVSNFSTLHQAIADLIGRTTAQCPAFVSSMQSTPSLSFTDENWYEMQQTLVRLGEDLTDVYYSHSMYDAGQSGDGHISGDEWVLGAQRYGHTVATILYGTESAVAAWFPISASRVDATHTDVTLTHSMGTDFTPTSGITGFRISGDNGLTWVTPSAAARQSANTIRLTHSDLGTVERAIQHQYGTQADTSGAVKDNSAIQSPLNFTKFYDLIAPGASALPVPHLRHISQRSRTDTLTSNTFANVEIGPADNDRYLIIPIVKGSNNALVTIVVLQVSGQSDLPLTVTTAGGSARGYHVAAHGNVPAAYGKTAQIVISYGASNFTTPTIAVYDVKMSSLSSTTPVVAFASDTDTDAVATLATSAGGFVIATAIQLSGSSTGGAFTGSETYAERLESAFETTRRVIADCSNTASNATNSTTVTFDASANCSIGLWHWL